MFNVITSDAAINSAAGAGGKKVGVDGYFQLLFVQKEDLDFVSILVGH